LIGDPVIISISITVVIPTQACPRESGGGNPDKYLVLQVLLDSHRRVMEKTATVDILLCGGESHAGDGAGMGGRRGGWIWKATVNPIFAFPD
jgi:hypothetical protein